jgi:hypothetical protein
MIVIQYLGKFGNNLFQYAFGRLLAISFNYSLGTDLIDNAVIVANGNVKGLSYYNYPTVISDINQSGNFFPSQLEERLYILYGYFQNIDYYRNRRKLIQSFFNYKKPLMNKSDIVLHVRLGDYKNFGPKGIVIHPQYYLDILRKEEFDKIYIVTDDPNDTDYFRHFRYYNPTIINSSVKDDFYFIMSFDKVIMSNSTFSWWATFLGDASTIYTFKPWIRHCPHVNRLWDIQNALTVDGRFMNE